MIKVTKYILLSSLISCSVVCSVHATIKFDISKPITKVTQTVGKVQGIATDAQKQVEHIKTYQKMLDGAKEGMKKIQELKEDCNKAMAEVNSIKSSAEGLKNSVENGVGQANSLTGSMADANQLFNLQTQQAELQKQYEKEVQELKDSRDAQIKKYEDNNAVLQAELETNPINQVTIYENNEAIEKLKAHYDEFLADKKQAYERSMNSLTGQMDKLKQVAANMDGLANKAINSVKGSLFGGNAAVAMGEMIAKNFYGADEDESIERTGEINNYRIKKEREDTADSYAEAVRIMSAGDEHLKYAESLRSNAQITDTEPAAIMLDISIKMEQMRELLKWAKLLAAELKMETAKDMVGMPKHLNNYEKDVQNFRMDDYDVDAAKALRNKVKNLSLSDIKKGASDIKNKLNDAQEAYQNLNDGIEAIKGFGE